MLDYSKVRFLWRGDAGRKVSSGRYEKIYDMGPRAATGDATFATAATRPIVDELSDWYGLAVDPAAENLIIRSEDFTNASWDKSRSTITANAILAPDGTITADQIIEDVQTGPHHTNIAFTVADSANVTISFHVRANTRSACQIAIRLKDATTLKSASFNLATGTVFAVDAGYTAVIQPVKNGFYRCSITGSSGTGGLPARAYCFILPTATSANNSYTGDGTSSMYVWGAQAEVGSVATQYKKTEGTTTAYSAVVAPITDAIPVTGTIIVWDNMVNAYASGLSHRIFDSEDLGTTFLRMRKSDVEVNKLDVTIHNNTNALSADLQWQPTNQRKRWFFAMTYNGTTVQVYRGDVQGNISKVIDSAYTPSTAAIRDMFLHTTPGSAGQIGASYLDILTYDDVLTQAEIQEIFYGTIPIFQQTAYAGDFVDKFRQKVQAEPASTYDNTGETAVRADLTRNQFDLFDDDVAAFFDRGIADSATLENLEFANTQIIALKALV